MANGIPTPADWRSFAQEYSMARDMIVHYSTVRSALTTFLMTVALAALSASFNEDMGGRWFFPLAGTVLMVVAHMVCRHFSRETERAIIYQKLLADWNAAQSGTFPGRLLSRDWESKAELHKVAGRMRRDPMNRLSLVLTVILLALFWLARAAPLLSPCWCLLWANGRHG